jgi:microsomal dipeptidase-like Zn-dependent dipeptidase
MLTDALLGAGLREPEVVALLGGNALRFLESVWGS